MLAFPFALAVAIALAPAVLAWWTGRTVLARVDDPALPELLFERRRRLATVALGGGVALAAFFAEEALWALPVLWVALLISAYPLRRGLYGERLSVLGYLRFAIFSSIGHAGLPLSAALSPALAMSLAIALAPDDRQAAVRIAAIAGVVSGGLIALWRYYYALVFLDLHRATRLRDSARPELVARFDAILDRAGTTLTQRPDVYRYGPPGAYVMNALAIPSRSYPVVALGDTLLATLTDEELGAVFAHEVAHHEQWTSERWQRSRWAFGILVVLVASLPALIVARLPDAAMAIGWCLPVIIGVMLSRRSSSRRRDETASDLRAVELTNGDADAMISALTKLHVYSRVPRRWPEAIERAATHPSLARRIQALRDTSASAPDQVATQIAAPLTAVRSSTSDAVVAFDRDRAYWFEGVSEDTPLDLHRLREAASSYRAIAYGDLVELHVRATAGGRAIEATDRDGRSWRVAIVPNDIPTVQAALDRVDVKLGRRRPTLAPAAGKAVRWLTLALLVMLAGAGQLGIALIPILIVFVRPTVSAAVAAMAAITAARLLVGARLVAWEDPVRQIALLLALILAVVLTIQMVRRVRLDASRGNVYRLTREAWAVAAVLGAVAGLIGLSMWFLAPGGPGTLIANPFAIAVATALLGAGAALATIPNAWWRGTATVTSLLAAGGGAFLSGDGWLFHRTAGITWTSPRLTATGVVRVPGGGLTLTSSPNAKSFAVTQYQNPRRGGGPRYLIGRFDDSSNTLRASTAAKIAFIDDDTFLALDSTAGDSLELRAEHVVRGDGRNAGVLWRRRIVGVDEPQLLIDRARHAWIVAGRGDGDWSFIVMTDSLGGTRPRLYRLGDRTPADVGAIMTQPLAAFADGGAIWSTLARYRGGAGTVAPLLFALTGSPHWELRGTDAGGERFLADVQGFPVCATELDTRGTLCAEHSPNGSYIWRATSARVVERTTELPPTLDLVHTEASDRVAAAERSGQRMMVLDVAARRGYRLTLPGTAAARGTRFTADVVARGEYVLVLSAGRDGAVVTRYAIR